MNDVIQTILRHRSIRRFKNEPLTKEETDQIIRAAQAASTSSFLQAYSIIGVTDKAKKEELAELAGSQDYVAENGFFTVFCADFSRHHTAASLHGQDIREAVESTEGFMVSVIDAALAAQNAAIAAESMGLGICYIGGLRNNLESVSSVLETPSHVLPLFGMAIGRPAQQHEQKPRLPQETVYHENTYNLNSDELKQQLQNYDETILQYYRSRSSGNKEITWSSQAASTLAHSKRLYLNAFTQEKGFLKGRP
ncbi:oxygen-insensitive NADPH nitroreductase [Salibacterium halotolerans]|uniref:FMN reductase (NADPH) n=1 Tax=Salibacterium halotolerans TaxID=1884432 RepID=A0A1I5QDE5_9BACI|nr:oxygen-insensitive NADPH nitroreductase [Salibacterium halotolerans]SFP44292.1 FMN reductase (NADPH) [Salibacterium halotolerans]